MSRREDFVSWVSANKLKHITPEELANLMEEAFFHYSNVDIWSINDIFEYSEKRQELISNKAFKKQNKKNWKIFIVNSKYYQTFLRYNPESPDEKEINDQINKSESLDEKKEITYFAEYQKINNYFENDLLTDLFYDLFEEAKKHDEGVLLDTRSSIIGVKAQEERLRFYSDKAGMLKIKISQEEQKTIVLNKENLEICKEYIAKSSKYFADHKEEVNINVENTSKTTKRFIYHKTFGFGEIKKEDGETIIVSFPSLNQIKILQKGHGSYHEISEQEFEEQKTNEKEQTETPAKRVPWDKYETAILIEGFWKLENKEEKRADVVRKVSKYLRIMALNRGLEIDEYYRNENGINIQLSNIALSFFPERSAMHRTAIFDEIADLYINNHDEFLALLNEAHSLITGKKSPSTENKKNSISIDETDFYDFIKRLYAEKHKFDSKKELAPKVANKTIIYLRQLENWLNENGYKVNILSIRDVSLIDTILSIIDDKSIDLEEETLTWYKFVCGRYKMFLKQASDDQNNEETSKQKDKVLICDDYLKVLKAYFIDGFAYENPLTKRRFVSRYKELNNKDFSDSDNTYLMKIKCCGFISDKKVYLPSIVSNELKDKIRVTIQSLLEKNAAVYYSTLFTIYKSELNPLFDENMLKSYLKFVFKDEYKYEEEFIRNKNKAFNLKQTMIDVFMNQGTALDKENLYSLIPTVSPEAIDDQLRDKDFVVNYRGKSYFYIKILYFEEDDLKIIESFISSTIQEKDQVSGSELYAFIKKHLPNLIENNPTILDLGFKNAIKYYLDKRFNFNGDVISSLDQELDVKALYSEFCSLRERFTIEELEEFRQNIHKSYIDYDAVFSESIRINSSVFVRKDQILFDTEKADLALSKYCKNGFCSFCDIINYTDFPYIQFPWNEYVMESYVYSHSKSFKLLHKVFNEKTPVGAIVSKKLPINNFDDLLVEILKINKLYDKEKALTFLMDNNYILTRKLKNIDFLINKARKENK